MSMMKKLPFRMIYYFRMGWALYFAFIFAAINTLTVTYYLAIEKIPTLVGIFPSFSVYVLVMVGIGVPFLAMMGYVHFKKSGAYGSEQDISQESYPYNFKMPPGWWREAMAPAMLELLRLNIKLLNKESLTEQDIKQIENLEKNFEILKDGGYIGHPKKPAW
jgi:hypothetical protein